MHFKQGVNLFLTYLYLAFVAISSIVFYALSCLIWLATVGFDKRKIILNLYASLWASFYIWCMPIWSVTVKGRDRMDMKKSYVVVSNHQSQLDILVSYRLFFPMRWVSKAEVFRLPVIGWNMYLNGYIKLKRGDKESITRMMERCEDLLRNNISVMLFPEGTRSKNGIVKPFKPGAFVLAKKMKKPILPLVINNTKNTLPKHSMQLTGRHDMSITVLDEIPYDRFQAMEIEEISTMVRERIASHVNEHIKLEQEKQIEKQTLSAG